MNIFVHSEASPKAGAGLGGKIVSAFIAFALIATMTVLPTKKAEAATTTYQVSVTFRQTEARSMLAMVNSFRASNAKCWNENNTAQETYSGLSPLTYDYELERAAMQRAAEIAMSFSHDRPNGKPCFTAFPENIYTGGENIAYGQRSAKEAYMDWREDNDKYDGQGHRRNMLDGWFTSIGIACVEVDGMKYWVQNFGSPNSGAPQTTAVNGQKVVSIDIEQSNISSLTLSAKKSKITVGVGKSISLPKVLLNAYLKNEGFGPMSELVVSNPVWTSSNSSVAQISGNKVVGKKIGVAKLTAKVNGKSVKVTVTVPPNTPAKPVISSAKSAAKKKISVKWKKPSKSKLANITGFEILCSTSKSFKTGKMTKTAKKSATQYVVKGLKSKKKYYVKVRAINKVNGAVAYSSWSNTKIVTVR